MPRTKKAKYTTYLNRTPVTEEMKRKVIAIAEKEGNGLPTVVRTALEFFLSANDINIPMK